MMIKKYFALSIVAASLTLAGCSSDDDDDSGSTDGLTDSGETDTGETDTGETDTGETDTGTTDSGTADSGTTDGESPGGDVMGVALGDPVFEPPTGSVVYLIDDVLMPAASTEDDDDDETEGEDGEEAATSEPATYTPTGTSVIDVARGTDEDGDGTFEGGVEELSSLVTTLLPYGDLIDALDDETQAYTVFAPSNDALAALDTSGLSEADIKNVLSYHVVPGEAFNTQTTPVTDPITLTTLQGGTLTVQDDGTGNLVVVDAGSSVGSGGDEGGDTGEGGDDSGTGGAPVGAEGSVFAAIESDPDLGGFESLVNSSGFTESLQDANNVNFLTFAPTDAELDASVTTAAAYIVSSLSEPVTEAPAAGSYAGTGAEAVSFEVTGSGDDLMVNGQPATFLVSGPGGAVVKYGQ